MGRKSVSSALTPGAAWQQLLGEWVYRLEAPGGSCTESRLTFTPDRRWVRTNSLAGGVPPGVQKTKRATEIVDVAVDGDAVLITLGSNPLGPPGGTMTVRFPQPNQRLP
jgi:hypothetical protein